MPHAPGPTPERTRDATNLPANARLRHPAPNVIDQRQQQIDPAGRHRHDPDDRPDSARKQSDESPQATQQKDPNP